MATYNVCNMGSYAGHFYKVVSYTAGTRTWTQAKAHAESLPPLSPWCGNPHLVTITSMGESTFVTSLLEAGEGCDGVLDAWIGIENAGDSDQEFDWITGEEDGSLTKFTNWCPGQPSQNGEPVGEVWIDEVGSNPFGCWNDNEDDLEGSANGVDNDKYIAEYDCTDDGVWGDPHIRTWSSKFFDFMGECDMTFINAPHFAPDYPIKIDIRTTIREDYSFIETAAIMIGENILEVSAYGDYFFNGVHSAEIPETVGPFTVKRTEVNKKITRYELTTDNEDTLIVLESHKNIVSVRIPMAAPARFQDSLGLLGDFVHGEMMARNGTTVIKGPNDFAGEWQVHQDEPHLFQTIRDPQHPAACILPSKSAISSAKRRLGEHGVSRDEAAKACANWTEELVESCIHDVMATGDLDLASLN